MPNYGYLHNTLLKYNSTIFKQQLTNISTVLNNTGNTTQLLTSFNALDVAQQKVLLSSKLLTEEQKSQCATMATLSSVNSKYTAEQLTRMTGVSAETLANWGLVNSTDSLTIAELAELAVSDKQAKNVLDKIITQNAQAVANGEVTASNIALASSEGGATLATGAFTTAIKANISALKTWLLTTPAGLIATAIGVVYLAVKAYDTLTVSVEEQKEKMEESLSAYEEAKSELSSITAELESQEQEMDELLAKEKLTYAEKGQLEELQAITKELRIQKDLAEKEEDRTEKQLAKDATDLFDKQFGDYEISEQAINEYQSNADITGNNAILVSDENDISAMIAGYKQFNELLDEAYGSGSQDDIDHFKSLTEDLEDSIFATAQELQIQQDNISAYYESIKDTPYEDLTTEQKEIVDTYNAISNAIALIYQQLDPNTWNSMQVDNIFSTDGIEKTKEELLQLAKSGELTPETIKGYTNLNKALEETTLSAEDLCNELYAESGTKSRQELIDIFGQDAVEKLSPEDLQIALTISTEEADKAIEEEKKKVETELRSLSKEGNVDLTIRPVVDSSGMKDWEVEEGSKATTFTSGEFIWQGDEENGQYVYVHYTPILPNGDVLTKDQMDNYLFNVLEGSEDILNADNKGLVLKVDTDLNIPEEDIEKLQNGGGSTQAIDDFIQKTGEWDDKVHGVQEQYYDTGNGIGYVETALDGLIAKHSELEKGNETTILL